MQSKVLLLLSFLLASLGFGLLVREFVPRGLSSQLRSRPSGALVQQWRAKENAPAPDPENATHWHTDPREIRITPAVVENYPVRLTRWGYSPVLVSGPGKKVIPLQPRPWFLVLLTLPWLVSGLCLALFLRSRRLERDSQEQQAAEEGHSLELGPGSLVGSYTIQELIGQGSQGEVYRAVDADQNPVAVKVMSLQFTKDREFRTRFEREIDAGMRLQHPNLLPTLKWGIQDGRYWMAQPFLPNGTLAERMAGKSLSEEETVRILLALSQALDYAHQHKIIHRDIKPANILLNQRDEPVLADFGVARTARYATITQQDVVLGTPAYMAPEQGKGEKVTFRSDLYSIGVLAYEMVTGELPFRGDPIAMIIAHISQPAPSALAKRPALNPKLDFIISRLLKKEPKERFQSAAELVAALRMVEDSRRLGKP